MLLVTCYPNTVINNKNKNRNNNITKKGSIATQEIANKHNSMQADTNKVDSADQICTEKARLYKWMFQVRIESKAREWSMDRHIQHKVLKKQEKELDNTKVSFLSIIIPAEKKKKGVFLVTDGPSPSGNCSSEVMVAMVSATEGCTNSPT